MKEYKICDISLSEIQGYLFEILQELDRICRKYDIKSKSKLNDNISLIVFFLKIM